MNCSLVFVVVGFLCIDVGQQGNNRCRAGELRDLFIEIITITYGV